MRKKVLTSGCSGRRFAAAEPLVVAPLVREDLREVGYFTLGKTDAGRLLTIVFTLRDRLVRVISARPMSRPERKAYASTKTS